MDRPMVSKEEYTNHRKLATHIESLYDEIDKLAKKKPTDKITPLISRKVNHVIVKLKEIVSDDDFLDAIKTLPVEGDLYRFDETLVTLGELRSIMDKQWRSDEFENYRISIGKRHDFQILK
ncbi:hypothetical protein CN378_14495 [Bacillus sp. AFS015802]|uniref:hypothetical protein n=1 Tax=Bacillus sp. AFS015802 TaxID=2033486 RepID=UPI000BF71FF6|nr:hypothetical protein [Bacillus sp. AFS015802]PFA66205.1 hypothetical protein CN378_14495 [Bacillus sp. AFS015802]